MKNRFTSFTMGELIRLDMGLRRLHIRHQIYTIPLREQIEEAQTEIRDEWREKLRGSESMESEYD